MTNLTYEDFKERIENELTEPAFYRSLLNADIYEWEVVG